MSSKNIRISAKALIIENGKLLCIKKRDDDGYYHILPGGGQRHEEPLTKTLKRECKEEMDADVEVHELRLVWEYISNNHEFAEYDPDKHEHYLTFVCTLKDSTTVKKGGTPDEDQVDVTWIELDTLSEHRLYSKILRRLITETGEIAGSVYLGGVN